MRFGPDTVPMAAERNLFLGSRGKRHPRVPQRFARAPSLRIVAPAGCVAPAVVAERFAARSLGIAWLPAAAAPALLIPRCRSVHTFGMRFELDVCFLTLQADGAAGDATVVGVRAGVRPRRVASLPRRAADRRRIATLELRSGAAQELGIEAGASVRLDIP